MPVMPIVALLAIVYALSIAVSFAQEQITPLIQYPLSEPALTHMVEQRYCGVPVRATDGSIRRSQTVLKSFRKYHPCPTTRSTEGTCPGWAIDHVIPLACGGCDAVSNMQWLPNDLKSSKTGKDRFERLIYCVPFQPAPAR